MYQQAFLKKTVTENSTTLSTLGHSTYRSCKTDAGDDNHSMNLGGLRWLTIENERGETVYEEKSRGVNTEYPYYLVPGKEKGVLTTELTLRHQAEIKDVETNPIETEIFCKKCKLHCKVEFAQVDGKYLKHVSGLGGAFCRHCHCSIKGKVLLVQINY